MDFDPGVFADTPRLAIRIFIERLAIRRDSANLAPRDSRDSRFDQPCRWVTRSRPGDGGRHLDDGEAGAAPLAADSSPSESRESRVSWSRVQSAA